MFFFFLVNFKIYDSIVGQRLGTIQKCALVLIACRLASGSPLFVKYTTITHK